MMEKEMINDPDYQAYLERLSMPPCPIALKPEELEELKREKQGKEY